MRLSIALCCSAFQDLIAYKRIGKISLEPSPQEIFQNQLHDLCHALNRSTASLQLWNYWLEKATLCWANEQEVWTGWNSLGSLWCNSSQHLPSKLLSKTQVRRTQMAPWTKLQSTVTPDVLFTYMISCAWELGWHVFSLKGWLYRQASTFHTIRPFRAWKSWKSCILSLCWSSLSSVYLYSWEVKKLIKWLCSGTLECKNVKSLRSCKCGFANTSLNGPLHIRLHTVGWLLVCSTWFQLCYHWAL